MAKSDSPVKLTHEDWLYFPDDLRRHELIDGEHYASGAPGTKHQLIVANLVVTLGTFVHENDLGRMVCAPFAVVLSDVDVVQPDLIFLAREHLDRLTEDDLRGAPDLAVEVLSEPTRGRDEMAKRHLYERHGVREYWIVDPVTESVRIHRLGDDGRFRRLDELRREDDHTLESPLFPGFHLPLAELFA